MPGYIKQIQCDGCKKYFVMRHSNHSMIKDLFFDPEGWITVYEASSSQYRGFHSKGCLKDNL